MKSHPIHDIIPGSDPVAAGLLPLLRGRTQQEFDDLAVDKFGFSPFTLMENAGRGAASIIDREYGPLLGSKIVICCGGGNNGGDGLVVARALYDLGACVHIILMKPPSSPEAQRNLALLQQLKTLDQSSRLHLEFDLPESIPSADLYVDALFGVGLNRPLQGEVLDLVHSLNASRLPVISLDLPSGLDADTGFPLGTAVQSDLTITFSAYKLGALFGEGPTYSGRIELMPLGLPVSSVLQESKSNVDWISTDVTISKLLPTRDLQAHKYSVGMVLVIGGSSGYSGAPLFAARAAARIGAGYVACAVPESIQSVLATAMPDIPSIGLVETDEHGIDSDPAILQLQPWLERANAIVIGPGLGRNSNTQQFIEAILSTSEIPIVVDADALVVASRILDSSDDDKPWILTPHMGEFERMTDSSRDEDRLDLAHYWSLKWNCTLILKGYPTITCHSNDAAVVCGSGNPALASAGTGDVLAGLCGGLLAQGCLPSTAAICASHIGGLAADHYASNHHPGTMIATDLIEDVVPALTLLEKYRDDSK